MDSELTRYGGIIREHIARDFGGTYRDAGGKIPFPFLTPGSQQYSDVLWDWDSWLSDIALRQALLEKNDRAEYERALPYERGCVLNFLSYGGKHGWIPIMFGRGGPGIPEKLYECNMHKPCLAQHAAFLVRADGGDAEWLREKFYFLQTFVSCYRNHHRHECGLYFWQNDNAIGVDNDPCTFSRPDKSSASIYLNSLMHRELLAMAYLSERMGMGELSDEFNRDAASLREAVQKYCWDEWLGFFFSADLNLKPVPKYESPALHHGWPRGWPCLIQRIAVWSGFMALWSGLASNEQAARAVNFYRDQTLLGSPFGVRSLSRKEAMYSVRATGNPSCWLGPIWGVANYLTFRGFVRAGLTDDARDIAEKTVRLFGRDFERFGALHEYYEPDSGQPLLNRGFQNWNFLVLNMLAWLEGKPTVEEF